MEISKLQYISWKSPDEMHFSSLQWQSELGFFNDEHRFFEDMLREYTMPIIESHLFSQVKEIIGRITSSKQQLVDLEGQVKEHSDRLEALTELDDPKEGREYREEHKQMLLAVKTYSQNFRHLKTEIFQVVSQAIRQQKQKRLLTGG